MLCEFNTIFKKDGKQQQEKSHLHQALLPCLGWAGAPQLGVRGDVAGATLQRRQTPRSRGQHIQME